MMKVYGEKKTTDEKNTHFFSVCLVRRHVMFDKLPIHFHIYDKSIEHAIGRHRQKNK